MYRFFVSPECIDGDRITLAGDVAYQLAHVLRARRGERIAVLDGSGWQHLVVLEDVMPRCVTGAVTERVFGKGEPSISITLYQAVLKGKKFEYVLQKGTELGVAAFVPFYCARSVPKNSKGVNASNRHQRWQKIVSEAAEQSQRAKIPSLEPPLDFLATCHSAQGLVLIPWERETSTGLKGALRQWTEQGNEGSKQISVITGPEGGFTLEEIEYARGRRIAPVSLGGRILRAETAAVAVVAAILYEFDELGS